jgi:hypothetical protein
VKIAKYNSKYKPEYHGSTPYLMCSTKDVDLTSYYSSEVEQIPKGYTKAISRIRKGTKLKEEDKSRFDE